MMAPSGPRPPQLALRPGMPDLFWDLELGLRVEEWSSPTLANTPPEVRSSFVCKVLAVLAVHCALIAAFGTIFVKLDGFVWGSDKVSFVAAAACCFCIVAVHRHRDVAKMAAISHAILLLLLSVSLAVLVGTLESKRCIVLALLVVTTLGTIIFATMLLTMTGHLEKLGSSIYTQGGVAMVVCLVSLAALVVGTFLLEETPDWSSACEAWCVMFFLSLNIIHESNSVLDGTSKIIHLDSQDYVFAAMFLYIDLGNFMRSLPALLFYLGPTSTKITTQ